MLVLSGGAAYAAGAFRFVGADGKIRACVQKSSGQVRLFDSASTKCGNSEVPVEWAQSGQAGPASRTSGGIRIRFWFGNASPVEVPAMSDPVAGETYIVAGSARFLVGPGPIDVRMAVEPAFAGGCTTDDDNRVVARNMAVNAVFVDGPLRS